MLQNRIALAIAGVAMIAVSCHKHQAIAVPAPPAPASASTTMPKMPVMDQPPAPPNPPQIAPQPSEPVVIPETAQEVPVYEQKETKPARRAKALKPPQTPPAPEEAPAPSPEQDSPPLQIAPLISPREQQEARVSANEHLESARKIVQTLPASLSAEQRATRDQVQHMIDDATKAMNTDLIAARSLAEKADLLARDLAGTIK